MIKLPTDMIERVTQAVRDRLDDIGVEGYDGEGRLDGSLWLDGLDATCEDLAKSAIAAMFDGCEIHEDMGVRQEHPTVRGGTAWDSHEGVGYARKVYGEWTSMSTDRWAVSLLRRLIITTISEVVETAKGAPSDG